MFIGSGLTKKMIVLTVLVLIATMLDACSRPNASSATKAVPGTIDKSRPEKIAKAYVYDGGRCEIDSTNPASVSSLIAISRKTPLGVNGWATTEGTAKPVSPMIFAVLSNEHGTYYLEGTRYPRPDVANGNHMLDLAGFNVAGNLSNIPVGDYKLIIAMGTEFVVGMCQTSLVVRISE
jgi:hypothetical protein